MTRRKGPRNSKIIFKDWTNKVSEEARWSRRRTTINKYRKRKMRNQSTQNGGAG